jgi:electron transport complex protein RnfG
MLDKLRIALVLFAIGIISGALIFATNSLTEDQIALNERNKEFGYYAEIFGLPAIPKDDEVTKTSLEGILTEEVEVFDAEGNLVGYIYKGFNQNSYGEVYVLVGIDKDGVIQQVVISSSTNTPNFVTKIKDNYLGNFTDQTADDVTFDAYTGATFTYGSVQKIVDAATAYFVTNRGVTNE